MKRMDDTMLAAIEVSWRDREAWGLNQDHQRACLLLDEVVRARDAETALSEMHRLAQRKIDALKGPQ